MEITVEISVNIRRADGSSTAVMEEITINTGDNPRYEADSVIAAIADATELVNKRLPRNT